MRLGADGLAIGFAEAGGWSWSGWAQAPPAIVAVPATTIARTEARMIGSLVISEPAPLLRRDPSGSPTPLRSSPYSGGQTSAGPNRLQGPGGNLRTRVTGNKSLR